MIILCPHCGTNQNEILKNGITTCDNCWRVYDTSLQYRILSAAWMIRNWHLPDTTLLEEKYNFKPEELELVRTYVLEQGLSHDEFIKILTKV